MTELCGKLAAATYGTSGTRFVGEVIGYQPQPTYIIQLPDGRIEHWVAGLVRPASVEEEIAYWRNRALAAEQTGGHANG
ncbi:hypothetical protein QEG23_000247 [Stenotrophomonas maltophilia]|uniref:Uncharacterized protein n=1 Tax=Stenotrophomonas maltophilia TaxID=40324 RepID=A0AAI9FT12_STEMA|nr:hypothetical protein [Stenotrophomonas maltophilia]